MNATITFATRIRPNEAAQHHKPRNARRSIFSQIENSLLDWLMSYPLEII
jgi:hypothetical protein